MTPVEVNGYRPLAYSYRQPGGVIQIKQIQIKCIAFLEILGPFYLNKDVGGGISNGYYLFVSEFLIYHPCQLKHVQILEHHPGTI